MSLLVIIHLLVVVGINVHMVTSLVLELSVLIQLYLTEVATLVAILRAVIGHVLVMVMGVGLQLQVFNQLYLTELEIILVVLMPL